MYLILGLAVAAVTAVLLYNHHADSGIAATWVGKAQQLAAVILVLTQAVEGLIGALDRATTQQTRRPSAPSQGGFYAGPRPAGYGNPRIVDVFDEEDWR